MKIFKGIHDQTRFCVVITPDCPIKDKLEKEIRTTEWEVVGQNEHWTLDEFNYRKLQKVIEESRNL